MDDHRLDQAVVEGTFSSDGRLQRPNGTAMVGPAQILAGQTESFARFRATHHVITDHLVQLDGNQASVRANVTAMHLWDPAHSDPRSLEGYFLAGGVLRAAAVRTSAGWRLSELSNTAVWRTGAGFAAVAATGRPGPDGPISSTARPS